MTGIRYLEFSPNGEVRYTLNTSHSSGCFRGMMSFCY